MGHITCKTVPTTGIIGVIAGDCFGAAYEFHPVKHGDFNIYKEPRFTDDTVPRRQRWAGIPVLSDRG